MCSGICTGHLNVCLSFELIFLVLLSVCFIPTACCSIITSAVQACHKSFADPFLGRAMHSLVGFAPFHSAARCCEISTPQNFDCACKADVYASCFNKSAALPAPLRMTPRGMHAFPHTLICRGGYHPPARDEDRSCLNITFINPFRAGG